MNLVVALSLAAAADPQGFSPNTLLHLAMVTVVTVAVLAIAGFVVAIFNRRMPVHSPEPAAAKPKPIQPMPAIQPQSPTGIPPEIAAVIAAAVASTMNRPVRVISIKRQNSLWEFAGRQSILTSHRIR